MIKKMVVLKNLESNIFEEAMLTLKENIEFDIEGNDNDNKKKYIIEEAENILNEYIQENSVIEKKETIFEKIINILNKKV